MSKKINKVLALLLSTAITMTSMPILAMTEEVDLGETKIEVNVDQEADSNQEITEEKDDDQDADSNQELTDEKDDLQDEINSSQEIEQDSSFENKVVENDSILNEVEDKISTATLLPIEEVYVKLDLTDYLPAELKAVPVSEVLQRLKHYSGETVDIDPEATTVWTYFKDENGEVIEDTYQQVERNDVVDVSSASYWSGDYRMELIVGTANQLDSNNVRFIVYVRTQSLYDQFNYIVYQQDEQRKQIPVLDSSSYFKGSEIQDNIHIPASYKDIDTAYIEVALKDKPSNVEMKIYSGFFDTEKEIIEAMSKDPSIDITSRILDQDMTQMDAGLKVEREHWNIETQFTIAYIKDSVFVGSEKHLVSVYASSNDVWSEGIYIKENAGFSNIIYSLGYRYDHTNDVEKTIITLKNGYPADEIYYYRMSFYDGNTAQPDNSKVDKAVVGHYDSLEEAAEAEDIKDQLFTSSLNPMYQGNFSGEGINFTIFAQEEVFKVNVTVEEGESDQPSAVFDEAPQVGSKDTNFNMKSAKQEDVKLDTYVMPYSTDTYYGYGYQTILINDENVDLSLLKPTFVLGNKVEARVNGEKVESGESIQDFSKGTIQYTAKAEDRETVKNYQVSFIKKEADAKLFVNGPDKREVFFDDYFGNYHDIFIANVGAKELTGLNVTLEADNVKLDNYWTVGGENNDTLAAFEVTEEVNACGELFNIAKIRLIPDGEGKIEGKLTISADGQEPRVITLTGQAGNPEIVTKSLTEGVKYVPYSYLVTTNNMHDWNKVRFTLADGKLPEGMQMYPNGEIYGTPRESGTFPIVVRADYSRSQFKSSEVELTLTVKENTDENVGTMVDEGYEISVRVPDVMDQYTDKEFKIQGEITEFIDFWLDGEKLEKDVDYTAEHGSTKITIRAQTFKQAGSGTHTIAAEFRVDGDKNKKLKKAAQNYTVKSLSSNGGGSSSSSGSSNGGGSSSSNSGNSNGSGSSSSGNSNGGGSSNNTSQPITNTTVPTGEKDDKYSDVNINAWYYSSVKWAYTNKLLVGISDSLFGTNMGTQQSMITTVLTRLSKENISSYNNTFTDIPQNKWYSQAMVWAKSTGILDHVKVASNEDVSRQELAIILVNYLKKQGIELPSIDANVKFEDEKFITSEAMDSLQVLYKLGIYVGKEKGRIAPTDVVTRAELSTILYRVVQLIESN